MSMLVIDVGTTSLRAGVVDSRGSISVMQRRAFAPDTPAPGLVEFDAAAMATAVLEVARAVIAEVGVSNVNAVGITNQRASTVVWDRASGLPVGPALGWQDLRTVGECIAAKTQYGLALAPNQSVTKIAWILAYTPGLEDRDLCFGTIDSWVAWTLSEGEVHATDHSNAAITGLYDQSTSRWNTEICEIFGIPPSMLPAIVDSSGVFGTATALPGSPALAGLVGDQQASLIGQGCVHSGLTKITFGTGGMLDVCGDTMRPLSPYRSDNGTFPIVAWSIDQEITWGIEAIMLSAGTNIDWLREDLQIIAGSAESHDIASLCDDSGGVVYVPALLGLGTPNWDYGARGTLLGLTRGSERRHIVRAVLEGIAQRGADMVEAAESETGLVIASLRVDGGMSQNPTFVQALANAAGKPVEVSPVVEATTLGAGYLAGIATGVWGGLDDIARIWSPSRTVDPTGQLDRAEWAGAIERASSWIPELSALDF